MGMPGEDQMTMDGARLLVVDDARFSRTMLVKGLEAAGFQCEAAADGYAAIEMLQSSHFDLLILDILMPDFDGLATLRSIRNFSAFRNLPVIVFSASNAPGEILAAMQLGVADYVLKGHLVLPDLVARVRKALKLSPPPPLVAALPGTGVHTERA